MKYKIEGGEIDGTPVEIARYIELTKKEVVAPRVQYKRYTRPHIKRHRKSTRFMEHLGMTGEEFLGRDPSAVEKSTDDLVQSFYNAGLPTTISKSRMKRYVKAWQWKHDN